MTSFKKRVPHSALSAKKALKNSYRSLFLLLIALALFSAGFAQAPKIGFRKGWDQERVLKFPKGERPEPSVYLKKCYIKKHLKLFEEKAGGSSYFVPQSTLQKFGCDALGRPDGQFVLPFSDAEELLKKTGGDISKIEEALGVPAGSWDGNPLLLIVVPDPEGLDVRIPSGNEAGANEFWIPGGFTSGGEPEAVVNQIPKGKYNAWIINPCVCGECE